MMKEGKLLSRVLRGTKLVGSNLLRIGVPTAKGELLVHNYFDSGESVFCDYGFIRYICTTQQGELVGYITMWNTKYRKCSLRFRHRRTCIDKECLYIRTFEIVQEYQSKGIGSWMISRIESDVKSIERRKWNRSYLPIVLNPTREIPLLFNSSGPERFWQRNGYKHFGGHSNHDYIKVIAL